MDKPAYSLESSADNTFYFFESVGEKLIKKAIGLIPLNFVYDVLGILENEQSEPFNKHNSYIGYLIIKNERDN